LHGEKMNNPDHPEAAETGEEKELMTAMFASLVMQQTNMASIFLGLAPHPQTGQKARDLEHAKYFIDQLEMLEAKTRGNLDKREEGLLKQSLTSLRLAFVEAVSQPAEPAQGAEPGVAKEKSAAPEAAETAGPAPKPEAAGSVPPAAEDSRKKFTKKY
jgi:Domain of unknown function (DUF1844)